MQVVLHVNVIQDLQEMEHHVLVSYSVILNINKKFCIFVVLNVLQHSLQYLFIDIHECNTGSHDCHQNATCINNAGSFTCQCNIGFTGNGTSCTG